MYIKKKYQIKIYDKSNVYKSTLSPKDVMSDISFAQSINWWQGELSISLNKPFDNADFIQSDLVKVSLFDSNNPSGRQIYFGWISKINRLQTTNSQTITLVCLWIATLLNTVKYSLSNSTLFNQTQDPSDTIKDIIDYFNTIKPWIISYSWLNIDTFWTNTKVEFSNDGCFDAIKKTAWQTDRRWIIDAEWQVYFKQKPATATYKLTNKKDTENINVDEDAEWLSNKLLLRRWPEPSNRNSQWYYSWSLPNTGSFLTWDRAYVDGMEKRIIPRTGTTISTFIDLWYEYPDYLSGDPPSMIQVRLWRKDVVLMDWITPVSNSDFTFWVTNTIQYDSWIWKFKLINNWIFTNSGSITTYWEFEKYLENTNIWNYATADNYATSYLSKNSNPVKNIEITVNSFFDIASILPWFTVKVLNFDYTIDNLQIFNISYNWDNITLNLEKYRPFWLEVVDQDKNILNEL